MQSIITRYHGPANTRGARMSATATGGIRKSYPYRHEVSAEVNHRAAACTFAHDLKWDGHWVAGAYDDKGAEVWVREWTDKRDSFDVQPQG